jgi:CHASE2 domain-containing sensor protein
MSNPAPPPVPEKWRMPLRIAAVAVAYILYRVLEKTGPVGAALIGLGSTLVAWTLIERYATWRRDRSGMMQVGTTILGLCFIGIGLYVYLR